MNLNHNIIHFDAKIPKTIVIKEKTLINQRKSHTKKSFTNQILYFSVIMQLKLQLETTL